MKKPFTLFILTVLCTLPLWAQAQNLRQVSVTGNGEALVDADIAIVHLAAQSQQRTSAAAKEEVDHQVNEVIATLESIGLTPDDLSAGQISLSPRYDYRNNRQEFACYFASRSIQVEITDLDILNDFLDAALAQEIGNINQIEYRSSQEQEAKELARELAIEDSKEKAEYLAEAYGVDLGAIISISYQSNQSTPVIYQDTGVLRAESISQSSTGQYIPDQLSFTDRISVIFELDAE